MRRWYHANTNISAICLFDLASNLCDNRTSETSHPHIIQTHTHTSKQPNTHTTNMLALVVWVWILLIIKSLKCGISLCIRHCVCMYGSQRMRFSFKNYVFMLVYMSYWNAVASSKFWAHKHHTDMNYYNMYAWVLCEQMSAYDKNGHRSLHSTYAQFQTF